MLSASWVSNADWGVTALAGVCAALALVCAAYLVPWTARRRSEHFTREFNFLWLTRGGLQLVGALYLLSLILRLQVWWSYVSQVIKPHGFHTDAMCRFYIGFSFGLLEPAFLLLVLFSCMCTVHPPSGDAAASGAPITSSAQKSTAPANPNLRIFVLTVGLTLPMCAAQVFAALFPRIITKLSYNRPLLHKFFAASVDAPEMCPQEPRHPNCIKCVFPEFSTLLSAAFAVLYAAMALVIMGRIAAAAINRMLIWRIRCLQAAVIGFYLVSIVARGASVVFDPFDVGFQTLRLLQVVCVCGLSLSVTYLLAWKPIHDSRVAERFMKTYLTPITQPTELMPLVQFKHELGESNSLDKLTT